MYNLKHQRNFGEAPIYENGERFTAELHIFGNLLDLGGGMQIYRGGITIWVDQLQWEYLSVLDFANAGLDLFGYAGKVELWYRIPGTSGNNGIENGLKKFETDQDFNDFISSLPENKVGVIFYEGTVGDFDKASKAATNTLGELFDGFMNATEVAVGEAVVNKFELTDSSDYDYEEEDGYDSATDYEMYMALVEDEAGEVAEQVSEEAEQGDEVDDDLFIDSDYELDADELNVEQDFQLYKATVSGFGKQPIVDELVDDAYSDDYDSDELRSLDSSSASEADDGQNKTHKKKKRIPKFKQFRLNTDLRTSNFTQGMKFSNAEEFRKACKEALINDGRQGKFDINTWYKVRMVCLKYPKCEFHVYASVVGKLDKSNRVLQVKTLCITHSCGRDDKNRHVNSSWLADRFSHEFRMNPDMKITSFKNMVRDKYMCEITNEQGYRARRLAKQKLEGSNEDQYAKLRDYLHQIKKSNPGTTVQLQAPLEGTQHIFKRVYICYDALKKGFIQGCRRLVGLDGCHIKDPHPGQLLSAVGIDGNNGMFPIAFVIVELETRDSWTWFLELLIDDLQINNPSGWVFISDKQKGLIKAIETLLPESKHRHCVRHLFNNFKLKYGGLELKQRLWACARATTTGRFQAEMDILKGLDVDAYNWLAAKPPVHWSRSSFDVHPKCDILLNNHCESFNAAILDARNKPIISMLERLRMYLMLRLARQREISSKWFSEIGPRIHKILEVNKTHASRCLPHLAGEKRFQVTTMEGSMYDVDLNLAICSCRRYQLTGIPCGHAISCIQKREEDPVSYVSDWYKKPAWAMTYGPFMCPIPNEDEWVKTGLPPVLPPNYHKQRGRPKFARSREPGESSTAATNHANNQKLSRSFYVKVSCSICNQQGHNKRSCKQSNQQSSQQTTPSAPPADI